MKLANVNPISVLIVDDSAIIRERLCALLAEDESICTTKNAASIQEARNVFAQCRPDAVVLDIRLPDGSGIEMLKHIKEIAPSCLVIMFTNWRDLPIQRECERCGADYFLHKSSEFEHVVELLHRLADQPSDEPQPGRDCQPADTHG